MASLGPRGARRRESGSLDAPRNRHPLRSQKLNLHPVSPQRRGSLRGRLISGQERKNARNSIKDDFQVCFNLRSPSEHSLEPSTISFIEIFTEVLHPSEPYLSLTSSSFKTKKPTIQKHEELIPGGLFTHISSSPEKTTSREANEDKNPVLQVHKQQTKVDQNPAHPVLPPPFHPTAKILASLFIL